VKSKPGPLGPDLYLQKSEKTVFAAVKLGRIREKEIRVSQMQKPQGQTANNDILNENIP